MSLVWKLLSKHVSVAQLMGFFFANIIGMTIILLAVQFYRDIKPDFSAQDGFIHDDYLIISKKVSTVGGLTGGGTTFDDREIDRIRKQGFCSDVAPFTASRYRVRALVGISGGNSMSTDMFFESVPDDFIDVKTDEWKFTAPSSISDTDSEPVATLPIILPRSYLNLYNFGYAETNSLPKISEELAKKIDILIVLEGYNGQQVRLTGHVVGFSNRLNTILVPQAFIQWSNNALASLPAMAEGNSTIGQATRLIMKVSNATDPKIVEFMKDHRYEIADDKLDAGKTMFLVKVISVIVIAVGLLISALSSLILMLSIYLLVQKNAEKLRTLLMIGYSPRQVAAPYQTLTFITNAMVFVLACLLLLGLRSYYLKQLKDVLSPTDTPSVFLTFVIGFFIILFVSVMNFLVVRKKVISVW